MDAPARRPLCEPRAGGCAARAAESSPCRAAAGPSPSRRQPRSAAGCVLSRLAFWASDLAQRSTTSVARGHRADELIVALSDPNAERIPLDGANGLLVVDGESAEGWVLVNGLDEAPEGKTYEAWVIEGDDRPVAAGLFSGGGDRTVVPLTVPVPEGAIVAVTVEEAGGVEQSTQDPVFVSEQAA